MPSFKKSYRKVQKFNSKNLRVFRKFTSKFSYDSVITYAYSIGILLIAFLVNLMKVNFGHRLPFLGQWNELVSTRRLWKLLDHSSEEVSKILFNLIRAVKENFFSLLVLVSGFVYLSLSFRKQ